MKVIWKYKLNNEWWVNEDSSDLLTKVKFSIHAYSTLPEAPKPNLYKIVNGEDSQFWLPTKLI